MDTVETPQGGHKAPNAHPDPGPVPPSESILDELQKILTSRALKSTEGQRALLRYVVEQTLKGSGDQLKEYTIGIDVFHRKDTFDPRRDNVVRAAAHRLRWALAKYYQSEGVDDPVRIEFPLGTYVPVFRFAPVAPVAAPITQEKPAWSLFPALLDWRVGVILLLVLGLAAYAGYRLKFGRASTVAGTSATAALPSTPSIAVLPFRILNDDNSQDFLSDGLTQDLTDSLAQIPGIRVVAPTSAFQYKGKALDVRTVGRELNVGAVLEGSVQRSGSHLRVTAQLSDTATGLHTWSSSYDREMKDALVIQREISDAITDALGVRLANSRNARQDGMGPSAAAYQDYLKGRYFWGKQTLKSLDTAIGYFERAIAADPNYAPAYSGLALCYASIPVYTSTTSTELIPKIRDAALKALALDSTMGEAHVELARAYSYDYQWTLAGEEFRKALELSPGVAVVHQYFGVYLTKLGRFPEAVAESQKALSLDPVSPSANTAVGRPLYSMRDYDAAIKQFKVALEFEPYSATTHQALGIAYVMKGMLAEGIAEMEMARGIIKDNWWTTGQLGYAYAVAGKTAAAREILNTLLRESAREPAPALSIAHVYLGLKDKDQALIWLGKAVEQRNVNLSLKVDPIYDPLRGDSRFAALLKRMNLD